MLAAGPDAGASSLLSPPHSRGRVARGGHPQWRGRDACPRTAPGWAATVLRAGRGCRILRRKMRRARPTGSRAAPDRCRHSRRGCCAGPPAATLSPSEDGAVATEPSEPRTDVFSSNPREPYGCLTPYLTQGRWSTCRPAGGPAGTAARESRLAGRLSTVPKTTTVSSEKSSTTCRCSMPVLVSLSTSGGSVLKCQSCGVVMSASTTDHQRHSRTA